MNNTSHKFFYECPFGGRTAFIIVYFPSDKFIINQIALCIFNFLLTIAILLLNGISVLTILRCSQLKEKLCYFQIFIQSTIDFGVGAISLPLYTLMRIGELFGMVNCVGAFISETIAYQGFALSVVSLGILTFERYTSTLYPFSHRVSLTKERMLKFNICAALLVLISPVLVTVSSNILGTVSAIFVGAVVVLDTFAYVRIFLVVRKRSFTTNSISHCSTTETSFNIKRRSSRERKLAKTCALAVFINYVCYIPAMVSYQLYKDDPLYFRISHSWSMSIYALNSCLNSLLFFWKSPILRDEVFRVLKSLCCRKNTT